MVDSESDSIITMADYVYELFHQAIVCSINNDEETALRYVEKAEVYISKNSTHSEHNIVYFKDMSGLEIHFTENTEGHVITESLELQVIEKDKNVGIQP